MPKRLLVVDDDVRLTRLVALTAAQLGIVTRQINDPSRALETFVEFKPDIVLLDLFMPEVDGIDVLHEILLTAIPTRVVLTSGAGEELLDVGREAMRFHGAGEAIVLAKPFHRAELVEVLTRLMDQDADPRPF